MTRRGEGGAPFFLKHALPASAGMTKEREDDIEGKEGSCIRVIRVPVFTGFLDHGAVFEEDGPRSNRRRPRFQKIDSAALQRLLKKRGSSSAGLLDTGAIIVLSFALSRDTLVLKSEKMKKQRLSLLTLPRR